MVVVGDTVLSYIRPAFVNSYPGVCGRRREGQTAVTLGGPVRSQNTDGWVTHNTRRRSLIAGVRLHMKATLLHYYEQFHAVTK